MGSPPGPVPSGLASALADRYRIERELGAGGMAIVYLAHDVRHDRPVAIKVLHEDLAVALGGDRFLAEIRTTARLQHPHILPLLDSGNAAGRLFYVMPFVAGESLRDRLDREKQLPIEDATRIAREAADALGHAHGHGIIHRDIKPENILLQEGHALVADFGIALAVSAAGGQRMTQTGLSLGTPQYMSPEQAMGEKSIDPRSDVYALGAVTYEMLTGEPPFTGATVQAIVAKVLATEPARPSDVRKTIPAQVEAAVLTALAKLPADRFATAAQFAGALVAPSGSSAAMQPVGRQGGQSPGVGARPDRRWPAIAGLASVVAVAAVVYAMMSRPSADARLPRQYDVVLPDSAPMVFSKGSPWGEAWPSLAISPEGDFVVYVADRGAQSELWYRSLRDTTARAIPGTAGAYQLSMSPDGESVAFIAGNRLRVVSLASGQVRDVGSVRRPAGLAWMPDGTIVSSDDDDGVRRFDPLGGAPVIASKAPCPLPTVLSAARLLCVGGVLDLAYPDSLQDVRAAGSDGATGGQGVAMIAPTAISDDLLVYGSATGSLIAAAWSQDERELWNRTSVMSGVRTETLYGARQMAVSRQGTMAFVPGLPNVIGQLVLADGSGPARPLPLAPLRAENVDVSPDGRSLVTVVGTPDGTELWVHDLATGNGARLAAAPEMAEPRWSPDGRRIAVRSGVFPGGRTVVFTPGASNAPDTIQGPAVYPSHWFGKDRLLAYTGGANGPILIFDLTRPLEVRVDSIRDERNLSRAMVSPDGRLLAYMVADEIAVQVMGGEARTVIGRGIDPVWRDARTLVFREGATWYRARINTDGTPATRPETWFSDPRFVDTNLRSHAMTPSGGVIYLQSLAKTTASFIRVVPDWVSEVRKAVTASGQR